jgi:hypothetical protein
LSFSFEDKNINCWYLSSNSKINKWIYETEGNEKMGKITLGCASSAIVTVLKIKYGEMDGMLRAFWEVKYAIRSEKSREVTLETQA